MRILSGKYKNHELLSPNTSATHPMGSRERLAIFNMLASFFDSPDFSGKSVLDVFAGTGALGLEALSRGAKSCVFIENNPKTLEILKKNAKIASEPVEIIKVSAFDQKSEKLLGEKFDLIFLDPPYDRFDDSVLNYKSLLSEGGVMVVSSPTPLNDSSRKYANCFITLFYS